jgi:hypothetical protein
MRRKTMTKKSPRLKGVGAFSIATVGLVMGAVPTNGVAVDVAANASANNCNDFAEALFYKGQDLFNKVEPFLKYEGVETGFQSNGQNVGGFYQVSTGAAEIFLKDAVDDTGAPGIAYCAEDANGVARAFLKDAITLNGGQASFYKVDNKVAFLKITLENVYITSNFSVGDDGTTTVSVQEEYIPPQIE